MSAVIVDYKLYIGMNHERLLFRISKGWIIRFKLSPTIVGKDLRFFTNYPGINAKRFERSLYQELPLNQPPDTNPKVDRFDNYYELGPFNFTGSFHFVFTTDGTTFTSEILDTEIISLFGGQGYFLIDNSFALPSSNIDQPNPYSQWDLDGVTLQTYLSKNLGFFKDWPRRLKVAKECGYNVIHFSPLQELGYSQSGYSLKDQLKVNPAFTAPGDPQVDWPQVKNFVTFMEREWSVLSMTDLVLNHTATDSPWIKEHPECTYNMRNSPYLVPAFLVDYVIWRITQLCARNELSSKGIPAEFNTSDRHIEAVRCCLSENLKLLNIHEFYQTDVDATTAEFKQWLENDGKSSAFKSDSCELRLRIAGPRAGRRYGGYVDFIVAKKIFFKNNNVSDACANLATKLRELNASMVDECLHHCWCSIDCVANGVRYRFFDPSGPCLKCVSEDTPLVTRYFVHPESDIKSIQEAEALATGPNGEFIMAYNGWVMNCDPLKNFAGVNSDIYVRRELVVWGDSVKLRYGDGPKDCPFLWERMTNYAKITAAIFHAVRLDNAHSTPINVAQAMLDICREVRPNMYILAELFTGDEGTDNMFLNKLGITSLVREALSAFNSHDEGRMVHRFGGLTPAGAFPHSVVKRRLLPTLPQAMFCDQTHDNPSPATKRSAFDFVPSAALVAMAACATASVRGYDELVPHMIDVVAEKRLYSSWLKQVNENSGMIATKAALNQLHKWLSARKFTETFVDQVDKNVIAVTRFCPDTAESVVLVAHSSFHERDSHPKHHNFRKVILNGRARRLLLEARTVNVSAGHALNSFQQDSKYINGLESLKVYLTRDQAVESSSMFRLVSVEECGGEDAMEFYDFPPGCITAVSVCLTESQVEAISRVRGALLHQFGRRLRNANSGQCIIQPTEVATDDLLPTFPDSVDIGMIKKLISNLTLTDINWLLYRCEREENCHGIGRKPYFVPGYGELVYCGFQGVVSVLQQVAEENDLGHPLCVHLRDGLWLMDFIFSRNLSGDSAHPSKELDALAQTLKEMFKPIHLLPRYLVPSSFGMLVGCLYQQIVDEATSRLGSWTACASSAVRNLALTTLHFYGKAPVTRLPPVLPGPALPGNEPRANVDIANCSLAAGLPHFAEGMWRSWGRDTFIALRGCLILTERFEEAAMSILQYASVMRHGMIPNLLGDGHTVAPRFNARDASWFWLYAITCFEDSINERQTDSNGSSLLRRHVWRWFPKDDTPGWPVEADSFDPKASVDHPRVQRLCDIMQEVLQRHAEGISFRERNAGNVLDCNMKPEGFDVSAGIQPGTGFIFGGSRFNCGTWMDKMGGSDRAGNRGTPATPRDGCAVELTGLAYAIVSWLDKMRKKDPSYYPHSGVTMADGNSLSWGDWAQKIRDNFEKKFFIPMDSAGPNQGCYKDLFDSCDPNKDVQLRPNFLITMAVATDLFTPLKAWDALDICRNQLVGPLGMRTLAPNDSDYRGYYNNSEDSNDFSTSQGLNYHQGPEWVWLTGFYIRSRLAIAKRLAASDESKLLDAVKESQEIFLRLDEHICSSQWRSLPELTNANGAYCHGSCQSQAWSIGTALEAMYDLLQIPCDAISFNQPVHNAPKKVPVLGGSGSEALAKSPINADDPGTVIRVSLWNEQLRVLCNVS